MRLLGQPAACCRRAALLAAVALLWIAAGPAMPPVSPAPPEPPAAAPAVQPAPVPGTPAAPVGGEPTPLELQLAPANLPTAIGVVGAPGLAELLRTAGFDARPLAPEEVDVGALDGYGLVLVNLERPLTLTGAAFLRDFVQRGGRLIACSWGATVAPRLQPAYPVYRLQEALQVRVTGWSATGNAYLRSGNGAGLFRGLAEFVGVRHRSTPLVEAMGGARVEASWVGEDNSPSGKVAARSPAIVATARSVYFAPNILAEATKGREMLRLLANAIGLLAPGAATDPGRLSLAELDVTLGAARRSVAAAANPEAAALLVTAEAKATAAVALAAQPPPPAATPTPPAATATDPAPSANGTPTAAAPADPPPAGAPPGAGAQPDQALASPDGLGLAAPAAPPRLAPFALGAIADAIDAAERVALLGLPCRDAEARGVLLPRTLLPPSRTAIAQLLDGLKAAGINLVLPEVYGGGVSLASGPNQDPRFAGHDPLASLLAEAAPRGIAVHAWVSLLSTGTPGPKSPFPPGWSAQTRGGARYLSFGQFWLCPAQTEVRDAVCDGIRRSLNGYAVQGVLLDGVDYGGVPEACYDPVCTALFRGDTGRNPRAETLAPEWDAEWLRWRRDRVGTLVRRATREIRTARPGVPIHLGMSAVGIDPRSNALADWREWARLRWVDGICPEMDSGSVDDARRVAERAARLAPGVRVLPMVSAARVRTAHHALNLVGAVQEGGAAGVVFDLPGPVSDRWGTQLARGPFRRAARLPW